MYDVSTHWASRRDWVSQWSSRPQLESITEKGGVASAARYVLCSNTKSKLVQGKDYQILQSITFENATDFHCFIPARTNPTNRARTVRAWTERVIRLNGRWEQQSLEFHLWKNIWILRPLLSLAWPCSALAQPSTSASAFHHSPPPQPSSPSTFHQSLPDTVNPSKQNRIVSSISYS